MVPGSQEMYVRELRNLSLADAKDKLWADGWLVADPDSPLVCQDKEGNSFQGKDRAGKRLAALEIDGGRIVRIAFYDTNTTTGEAVPIPTDRIFVR
jgi:hypothetical protein